MSKNQRRRPRRPRDPAPDPDSPPPGDGAETNETGAPRDPSSEATDSTGQEPATVHLRGIESLERLRENVESAAREIQRLREENVALGERIRQLESRPGVKPHPMPLALDADPEVLRRRIASFIESIDRYLDKESDES